MKEEVNKKGGKMAVVILYKSWFKILKIVLMKTEIENLYFFIIY